MPMFTPEVFLFWGERRAQRRPPRARGLHAPSVSRISHAPRDGRYAMRAAND